MNPPGSQPPSQAVVQVQPHSLVNSKTKTALANMLSNRLQNGGGQHSTSTQVSRPPFVTSVESLPYHSLDNNPINISNIYFKMCYSLSLDTVLSCFLAYPIYPTNLPKDLAFIDRGLPFYGRKYPKMDILDFEHFQRFVQHFVAERNRSEK